MAASKYLLRLEFGDRLDPTGFRSGKADLVAGVQIVQRQAVLYLELFGSAAGIRSDGAVLRLPDRDAAIDPVNCCYRSGKRLLGQRRRTDDGEDRSTGQNDLRDFHGSLPVLEIMRDKPRWPDWFLQGKHVGSRICDGLTVRLGPKIRLSGADRFRAGSGRWPRPQDRLNWGFHRSAWREQLKISQKA
jgi:hypothetical protein